MSCISCCFCLPFTGTLAVNDPSCWKDWVARFLSKFSKEISTKQTMPKTKQHETHLPFKWEILHHITWMAFPDSRKSPCLSPKMSSTWYLECEVLQTIVYTHMYTQGMTTEYPKQRLLLHGSTLARQLLLARKVENKAWKTSSHPSLTSNNKLTTIFFKIGKSRMTEILERRIRCIQKHQEVVNWRTCQARTSSLFKMQTRMACWDILQRQDSTSNISGLFLKLKIFKIHRSLNKWHLCLKARTLIVSSKCSVI